MKTSSLVFNLIVVTAVLTNPLSAQTVLTGDHSVDGNLCVGNTCTSSEDFVFDELLVKAGDASIRLDSASVGSRDWRIRGNNSGYLGITEDSDTKTVFKIHPSAAEDAFVIEDGGIGLGTAFPGENIHIFSPTAQAAEIRFETTGANPQSWDLGGNEFGFFLFDGNATTLPFIIEPGAASGALYVSASGSVGFGTETPSGGLELSTDDAFNFFRITAEGAAVNESVDITFTGGPLGTGQLRYNIVDGDNQEMSLDANGNMVLDGTLTTAGPTCAGGCDRVFDADYELPSMADYAARMYADAHLPSVGPTQPGQPVNLSERIGEMLNALEHAHIYIDQLHGQNARQSQRIDAQDQIIAALAQRLAALEAQ